MPYSPSRHPLLWAGPLLVCGLLAGYTPSSHAARQTVGGQAGLLQGQQLPTGKQITPRAASGSTFSLLNPDLPGYPNYRADHATSSAISPDGKTLLVMTSGYNRWNDPNGEQIDSASDEYVFVYDISQGPPQKTQVIQVPNTFLGIAWNPNPGQWGDTFYVSGGVDDEIHVYTSRGGQYEENGTPIALGHEAGIGLGSVSPMAAGLSVSPQGDRLIVANLENDSVSLVDLANRSVLAEQDLRPGKIDPSQQGVPGGEYPVDVVFDGAGKAYVSSTRDREIDVLEVGDQSPSLRVARRIATRGQPNKMILNKSRTRLYVANDNSDTVAVVDTASDQIVQRVATIAPPRLFPNESDFKGAGPNSLRLSPDERFLFVSNGGFNSVAVIRLAGAGIAPGAAPIQGALEDEEDDDEQNQNSRVIGLVPTGWYPESVNVSPDGRTLYVLNGKNNAGPDPLHCSGTTNENVGASCTVHNQYILQLEKAGFLAMPMPGARELGDLTRQVAYNNHFLKPADYQQQQQVMGFLRDQIQHVIYVVKENRTYDQVLGDLARGNGDPRLALLAPYMPNHQRWASQFVTLDNFYDSGEVSNVGWNWSTAARTTDFTEKESDMNYAGRGFTYDQEGANRNINVGIASQAERERLNPLTPADPDILPKARDVAAPDGPGENQNIGQGYLWNSALRAGLSLRNYGFYGDLGPYSVPAGSPGFVPMSLHPYADGTRQFFPTKPALRTHSDLYFRGYDNKYPDYWREQEWEREFEGYVANGNLPNLVQVRFMHDHTGSFSDAIDGVDTVAKQAADNDYATARLIQRVANSPYKNNTLIFVIEDDAQDGQDHVDAHRSVAFVIGPYVKQRAVISKNYNTVSMLRTIEDLLGMQPMGLNDALAAPMTEVFDTSQQNWTYNAVVPPVLRNTDLPLPPSQQAIAQSAQQRVLDQCFAHSRRAPAYWTQAMRDQDFDVQDQLDVPRYNHALWAGFEGKNTPYPDRNGRDLSQNRHALLQAHKARLVSACEARSAVAGR